MQEELEHSDWKGRTGGTPWMQNFMMKTFRYLPLCLIYFFVAWGALFYMLFNRQGFKWAYRYFRQRRGYGVLKSVGWVYANHFRFGQVVADRFAMYSGKRFKLDVEGQEIFDELERGECGFMQLSSHVGNYELAGYTLVSKYKTLYALMFGGETQQVMSGRSRMFADKRLCMIPMQADLSHIFLLNNALADGQIVSMAGDRVFGSQKHVRCRFMGAEASFPYGPFVMAVQRDVPVLAVFVMKESMSRYRVYVRRMELSGDALPNRKAKVHALAQTFATALEGIMQQYPAQWYNYYDFWKE